MEENQIMQVPVLNEDGTALEEQGPAVAGELHIRVYDNGSLELYVPETSKELSPEEIENLTFIVNKQLQEQRIAKMALDMFKSRLG